MLKFVSMSTTASYIRIIVGINIGYNTHEHAKRPVYNKFIFTVPTTSPQNNFIYT